MIDVLFTETLTITRQKNAGTFVKGKYTDDGQVDTITITCSVQPVTGDEVIKPPEGERTRDQIYIFTKTQLLTSQESALKKADVLTYNGRQYEIERVERWNGLMPHFKCMAMSILRGEAE